MIKSRFDPNAAFRNIVGVQEEDGQNSHEHESVTSEQGKEEIDTITIAGNKMREETRSKRVNLIVKPSVYHMSKAKCDKMNISLNECINQFLEKWSKD